MVGGLHERFELTKYVSASTISSLTATQEPKRVSRTLVFTDVRGFTSYTERRPPEHVVSALNRLLDGDIDKFVGEAQGERRERTGLAAGGLRRREVVMNARGAVLVRSHGTRTGCAFRE